jgi:hypothetical protein
MVRKCQHNATLSTAYVATHQPTLRSAYLPEVGEDTSAGDRSGTRSPRPVSSRSPRYLRDQIGSHHQWLVRHQETVLRSPWSKFSPGPQTNSCRNLGDVHGVAPVVPWPIGEEGDQAPTRPMWRIRQPETPWDGISEECWAIAVRPLAAVRPF